MALGAGLYEAGGSGGGGGGSRAPLAAAGRDAVAGLGAVDGFAAVGTGCGGSLVVSGSRVRVGPLSAAVAMVSLLVVISSEVDVRGADADV